VAGLPVRRWIGEAPLSPGTYGSEWSGAPPYLPACPPMRNDRPIHSERDAGMSPGAVQVWFHRLYDGLGVHGASSHSGRRTFVTRCAKRIVEAGGSLRHVQELAGHASLATTQRYIQGDTDAKRKVVDL
jgi:integrase